MERETISVDDLSGLERLLRKERSGRILLNLPALNAAEAKTWQSRLNSHYSNCGCSTGQVFLTGIFGPYLIALWFRAGSLPWPWWVEVLLAITLFFGSALLGKATGLTMASRRLRNDVNTLTALLRERGRRDGDGMR
ncbi:MAG TPA: hypothetical protein VMW27_12280 [Thermoanaerobaculia bacterium]|nr:hypothetical protein [Thermoanaerobaculia bacterium]